MAETIKGINIVLGSDTTGLSKALGDVNKHSKDIQSELKQVERLLKMDPSNTELLAQKQKLLGDAVSTTKEKLDALKNAQAQVNEQFQKGEINEGQYRAFQREIAKTEQDLKKFEDQLKRTNPALEAFGVKAKETGEKMKDVGGKLTKGLTVPIAAAATGLVAAGTKFDDAYDKIRISSGATGDALEGLRNDFRRVAQEVPASFDDISTAIADYNTRLELSGEDLQDLSIQTLELARITKSDLGKTIEETSQSFQAFNVPADQYGQSLDFIFKVSQSTGIEMGRLQANMVRFSPTLKQMGFDFEQSAVLMGKLDKAGVDVEQTLAGMTKSIATMAKKGITDANKAIEMLFKEIKDAPSDIEGTQAALDVFGAKAGPALASAIREGKLEYQDLMDELKNSNETILGAANETKDWAEMFKVLKNNLLLAVEPLSEQLFDAISGLIPLIKGAISVIAFLIDKFTSLPEGVQTVILVLVGLLAILGPVLSIFGTLTAAAGALAVPIGALVVPIAIIIAKLAALITAGILVYKHWDEIKEFAAQLMETIKEKFEAIKKAIIDAWEKAKKAVKEAVTNIAATVKDTLSGLVTAVYSIGSNIVRGLWDGIASMASWIKDKISGFVGGIVDGLKGFLGIQSPSKVFAGIGENMGLGLIEGIISQKKAIEAAISGVMPEFSMAGGSSNVYNNGGNTFIFNVTGGWDEIERELHRRGVDL